MRLCVLRSGGDYKPEHVQRLAKQVPGLVALSDVPVEGVQTIPLLHDWPTWWAKLEICRPDIPGDVFYLDLDTLVLDMPPDPTVDTVLTDFLAPKVIGSGLMYLTWATRQRIWQDWIDSPDYHMSRHKKWPDLGDQGFLFPRLQHAQRWQDIANVYSYKVHCRKRIPEDAQIVCFHGKPRPWEVGY